MILCSTKTTTHKSYPIKQAGRGLWIVNGLGWQWPLRGNWKCRRDYWSLDAKRLGPCPSLPPPPPTGKGEEEKIVNSHSKETLIGWIFQLWLKLEKGWEQNWNLGETGVRELGKVEGSKWKRAKTRTTKFGEQGTKSEDLILRQDRGEWLKWGSHWDERGLKTLTIEKNLESFIIFNVWWNQTLSVELVCVKPFVSSVN